MLAVVAPVALAGEEGDVAPEAVPFLAGDGSGAATAVAGSGCAVGVHNNFETHVAEVGADFIGADAPAGQLGVQEFQSFPIHLIAQDCDAVEQFR